MSKMFEIAGIPVGGGSPLFLVAGPCVIESEEIVDEVCGTVKEISERLGIQYIFKSSYDKANRQSYGSFRGPGIEKGLEILAGLREKYNVPVLTDVHSPEEALKVRDVSVSTIIENKSSYIKVYLISATYNTPQKLGA